MYTIVYYGADKRPHSIQKSGWVEAYTKASQIAIRQERPFPIIIKDDLGRVVLDIKG